VVPVQVLPLRDRPDDIAPLARHFVEKICRLDDLAPKSLGPGVVDRLCSHSWPGNVRELENSVEMAIALSEDRDALYPSDFPLGHAAVRKVIPMKAPRSAIPESGLDFHAAVSAFEQELIEQALERTGGNKTYAANLLGLKRTTLLAKMRQHEGPVRTARSA
jgi:DNA-binding NtrC family response regulator